jgi:tripartite-type tricarboxylate transporter receptor subunit TctC
MLRRPIVIVALASAGAASAQQHPSRAAKVIVPWPPGPATDIAARLVASRLREMQAAVRRERKRYATIIRNANVRIER